MYLLLSAWLMLFRGKAKEVEKEVIQEDNTLSNSCES